MGISGCLRRRGAERRRRRLPLRYNECMSAKVKDTRGRCTPALLVLLVGCGARSELGAGKGSSDSGEVRDASARDAPPESSPPCTYGVLASVPSIEALALDESYVYYACMYAACGVGRVSKAGGAPQVYAATDTAWFVAVDGEFVYWGSHDARAVVRAPKDGGTVETVATSASPVAPWGVAVDDTSVYFGDDSAGVWKVPKGGGTAVLIAGDQPSAAFVALDGPWLVWGASEGVARAPRSGGAVELIAARKGTYFVTADDGWAYWTDEQGGMNGEILRSPTSGGAATLLISAKTPIWLALDATMLYWADLDDDRVARIPKGGGAMETVAQVKRPFAVAVDDRCVYYSSSGVDGGLLRTPK